MHALAAGIAERVVVAVGEADRDAKMLDLTLSASGRGVRGAVHRAEAA